MSRQQPRSRRSPQRRTGRRFPTLWVATGAIVVAVVGLIFVAAQGGSQTAASEVECNRTEFGTYHVHANLKIYINGQEVPVPANVGVRPGDCLFWLHTHDGSGTIHVEAPSPRDYTLGQFFKIWE